MPFYANEPLERRESLNLGSEQALESAQNPAYPTPPPGYKPGPTALVNQEQAPSMLSKISDVLLAGGTRPGDIPTPIRMRLAQQQADLEVSQNKLAWDNYYQTIRAAQETTKQHNQNAMFKAYEMLPQFKGMIHAVDDPTQRTALTRHLKNIVNNFAPGVGDVLDLMNTNPAHVLGYDAAAAGPSGKAFMAYEKTLTYEQKLKDPTIAAHIEIVGRDTIPMVMSRLPFEAQKKIAAGEMTENEFLPLYEAAITDESFGPIKPVDMAFAKAALHTDYGEEIMLGNNIKTNKSIAAHELKRKGEGGGSVVSQLKDADALKAAARLEYAEQHPGKVSDQEVKQLKSDLRTHIGLQARQSSPGESLSTNFSRELGLLSNNRYTRLSDIEALPDGPERDQAMEWANTAQQRHKQAAANATLSAQMARPEDMATKDFYSIKALQQGELKPVLTPMSVGERLNSKDIVKLQPDEVKKFTNIKISKTAGKYLFDLADKAFPATSGVGQQAQATAFWMLGTPADVPIRTQYPDMALYHDGLEAWAGNNAKALGGEVGVLTNIDINRWVKTFPSGADTKKIRTTKRQMFNDMVDLVSTTHAGILAGTLPEDYAAMPQFRSKVEGMLGSLEGMTTKQSEPTASTTTPQKKSPGESLLEKMRKGQ